MAVKWWLTCGANLQQVERLQVKRKGVESRMLGRNNATCPVSRFLQPSRGLEDGDVEDAAEGRTSSAL